MKATPGSNVPSLSRSGPRYKSRGLDAVDPDVGEDAAGGPLREGVSMAPSDGDPITAAVMFRASACPLERMAHQVQRQQGYVRESRQSGSNPSPMTSKAQRRKETRTFQQTRRRVASITSTELVVYRRCSGITWATAGILGAMLGQKFGTLGINRCHR